MQRNLAIGLPVRLGHVGKARAKAIVIGTDQGIVSLQVDVVGDDDQRALLVFQIDSAGCVGKNDGVNVHLVEHAHGEGDFAGRIAFVQMDASLHGGDWNAAGFANHHLPGVSDGGRAREEWNVGVGNADGVGEVVGKAAKAGAQYQSDLGTKRGLRKQELCGGLGVGEIVWLQP